MAETPPTLLHWDGTLLRPHAAVDLEILAQRYAPGSTLRGRFSQPRSLPRHRLYWAVLSEVVAATDLWPTPEDLHEAVKLELRMVRGVALLNGEVRFLCASIAFDAMDEGQFRIFFDRAMDAIRVATGIDIEAAIAAAKAKTGPDERRAA